MSQLSLNPLPLVLTPRDLSRSGLSTGKRRGESQCITVAMSIKDHHEDKKLQSFSGKLSITHRWKQLVFLFLPATLLAEMQKAPGAIQTQRTNPLCCILEVLGSLEAWFPCQLKRGNVCTFHCVSKMSPQLFTFSKMF